MTTTHARLQVAGPYPLVWERLIIVAAMIDPAPLVKRSATNSEIVQRWHEHAVTARAHATRLERLLWDGWQLTAGDIYLEAQQMVDTAEDAQERVRASDVFERGYPIEMRVAASTSPDSPAGGLLYWLP